MREMTELLRRRATLRRIASELRLLNDTDHRVLNIAIDAITTAIRMVSGEIAMRGADVLVDENVY